MRTTGMWVAAALAVWSAGFGGAATTNYVVPPGTPGGKGTPPFNAWTSAATNIQYALNAAVSGDVVLVTNAWYPLEAELIVTQYVELRSWNDGNLDPAGTSLDGQAARRCMYLNRALVSGFTLSNGTGVGTANSNYGGAVYLAGGTLSNCVVAGGSANLAGGGVYVGAAAGVVEACRIEGNVQTNTGTGNATGGGGVYLVTGATLRNCTVARNNAETRAASYGGGGVLSYDASLSAPIITGCLVESNKGYAHGGGVMIWNYNGQTLRDCTIAGNTASGSGSVGGGLAFYKMRSGNAVLNCRIEGNYAPAGSGGGVGAVFDNNTGYGLILATAW